MTRETELQKVDTEIQYYLGNFELGYQFHDVYLTCESEAVLNAIPQILFLTDVITVEEKVKMSNKIENEKKKIKEKITYG